MKLIPFIVVALAVLAVFGCAKKDVRTSMKFSRLGVTAAGLVRMWDVDRATLLKYKNMLPEDSPDFQSLTDIIDGGDLVQKELSLLVVGGNIPSINRLKSLFTETDKLVVAGTDLYNNHIGSISFSDKMRAQDFGNSWRMIKSDISVLDRNVNESDRYKVAKDVLSFALEVTRNVVIPALRASGKI